MKAKADGAEHLTQAREAVARLDGEGAITHLSAALRLFTAAGENRQAALVCARLGDLFANYLGNLTAARAWFTRAKRMLEHEPPCIEQGWVAVAAMGCDVDDPEALLANAELALDRARRFGDVNLESKALADGGLAHVQAGRVVEGMALLDEAMALVCGPADDDDVAGRSVCSFFTACYFACDFDRAESWVDLLRKRRLIGGSPGVQLLAAAHCDAVQATLLCELGHWSEAEQLLLKAIGEFERVMGMPSWHPAIALAELRIRQGRLAEAEQLLLGKDGHLQALLPTARLHLARGDLGLARATALRGLRALGSDRLRASELLALLVDVELAAGDLDAVASRCADLVERSKEIDVPALVGRIAATRARAAAASGNVITAIEILEEAVDALPAAGLPLLRALLLVDLVRLHRRVGNSAAARVEAARAVATLDGLDIVLSADDLAVLEGSDAPSGLTATLTADGGGWLVTCGDARARLGASKGLSYLAELVQSPGVERHALDLVDRVEGVSPNGIDRRSLGDAGELLDAAARAAYRHRIEGLRVEIDDAIACDDLDTAERLQGEVDQLVGELARAFGLGGRERHAGSAAERARLNVTRALRTAIARVSEVLPEAGAALDRGVRTGTYCSFVPDEHEPIRWIVQSRVNVTARN